MNYPKWYLFPVFVLGILTGSLLWGSALALFYSASWALTWMPWGGVIALVFALACLGVAIALDSRPSRAQRRLLSWGRL